MDLLLDTQVMVWIGRGDDRLTAPIAEALLDPDNRLFVSAVTAFEFSDLHGRGRFGRIDGLGELLTAIGATVLDYPAEAWRIVNALPPIHRDPVDRMLVAHAIHADLTLATADVAMRAYPVRSLW